MTNNEQLITSFYEAFQRKDYAMIQSSYADNATFSDPVFQYLNAAQVRAMWEMLISRGKDLQLNFNNVQATETNGNAELVATYTFTATGRKVTNHILANFIFENGKIVQHTDHFNFYRWARQALGLSGLLLGWTPFIKNKVRQTAMNSLTNFMNKK